MAIQTSACYRHGEYDTSWPVPFAVVEGSQVGVTLINGEGQERELVEGTDYVLSGNWVVCIVPPGCMLSIWMRGPLRVLDAGAVGRESRELRAEAAAMVEAARQSADEASGEAVSGIESARALAVAEVRDVSAGAVDELRRSVEAASASAVAEVRQQAREAVNLAVGDVAEAARESLNCACAEARANFASECERCARLAEQAGQAARMALEGARIASLHHHRPGIAAVRRFEDIFHAPHGLYILNPHLSHAPTPFMGIWPASCLAAMTWDGIFFVGEPYPEKPTPPPLPPHPRRPMPPGHLKGDADDWLPCEHHKPAPTGCGCGGKE